ncbi:MAG: hypothetical protein J6V71_02330 [Clostridia bacterium]|nr:hypothetical protein [Clostridia bacterium]
MPILVKAENRTISANNFLPQTDLENLELVEANAVYCDKSITAIVENSYLFTLYFNGERIVINDNIDALNQILDVKLFDDNCLFFSANARLYCYDLQTKTYTKVKLGNSLEEPVSYFDFNQNYLVTTYQDTCKVFQISESAFTSISSSGIKIADGSNVAINQKDELFIVGNNGIYKTLASLPAVQTVDNTLTSDAPSTIIANDQFIYYILNNKIYSISLLNGNSKQFSTYSADSDYQLGNIVSPKKISFIDENLLVIESDSIQEFKIDDDKLIFTGYAIAKGKTAYNRVLSTASKIEKVNDTVAVLDDFKLTIFTDKNTDRYARENYQNYPISSLSIDDITPSNFALGDNNALLYYDDGTITKFLSLLDFSKKGNFLSAKATISPDANVRDVCYQSGAYYVLCDVGQAPQHVYKSTVDNGEISFTQIDNNTSATEFTMLSVDVYGNIYLANSNTISKLNKSDDYTELHNVSSLNNIQRLQTDLLGNLFVLTDGKVRCINNGNDYSIDNVKSFALDFVDDNVYIIKEDCEIIYSTTEMDNVSINDLTVPNDYTLTNPEGTYIANENLEFFTVQNDVNTYVINVQDNKFAFEELTDYSGEYVKICAVEYMGTQRFLVLVNQNDIVLVEVGHAETVLKEKQTDVISTAFIATNVHAYYLPIINVNADFAFTDTAKIRLNKTVEIKPRHKINFLDCDYYYADFTFNDKTYSAYIPCSYTVDILSEDFAWDSYNFETLKATSVYTDNTMQTVLVNLADQTQVRLIERGDTVSKIAYKLQDGTYAIGYIYTNSIIDNPSIAIRNILIIVAVVACVCGTLTYFLLRKKKSN